MFWLIPLALGGIAVAAVLESTAEDERKRCQAKCRDAERDFERHRQRLAAHEHDARKIVRDRARLHQQAALQRQVEQARRLLAAEQALGAALDREWEACEQQRRQVIQKKPQTSTPQQQQMLAQEIACLTLQSTMLQTAKSQSVRQQQALREALQQTRQRLQTLDETAFFANPF
jgi:hypothetical protein